MQRTVLATLVSLTLVLPVAAFARDFEAEYAGARVESMTRDTNLKAFAVATWQAPWEPKWAITSVFYVPSQFGPHGWVIRRVASGPDGQAQSPLWTTSQMCAPVAGLVAELETLAVKVVVPGPDRPPVLPGLDGGRGAIWVRQLQLVGGAASPAELGGHVRSPAGLWSQKTESVLKDCWTSEAPEMRSVRASDGPPSDGG